MGVRERVLAFIGTGFSDRQAAERFGLSAARVSHWRRWQRERGECPAENSGARSQVSRGGCPSGEDYGSARSLAGYPPSRNCAQGLSFYGTIRPFFEHHRLRVRGRPCHRALSPSRLEATRDLAREPVNSADGDHEPARFPHRCFQIAYGYGTDLALQIWRRKPQVWVSRGRFDKRFGYTRDTSGQSLIKVAKGPRRACRRPSWRFSYL